jgi:CelD/BcsL family acetyltransferase involved in cellulose biosynthesis
LPHDLTFTGVNAFVAPEGCEPRADSVASRDELVAQAQRTTASAAGGIRVELAAGARLADIEADWHDLIARADTPNVFMNPTLVRLAEETYPGKRCIALLAWQDIAGRPHLVGVWAFAIGRAPQSILPVVVLSAPPTAHAFLATPVIDRSGLDATLEAMLEHIAGNGSLPKIIALDAMGADGATMQALTRVLAARNSGPCVLGQALRPKLASELDGKHYMEKALSGSSRKKLRQHRRRLGEKGALESQVIVAPAAVRAAFEEFLQLEASGWKGRQHTALLSDMADASFARAMIAELAPRADACIHALRLDGHPVSMQIVLRAGPAAFTWKTTYDEALHDFSPGMLLLEDYTAAFLADDSIAFVDSCAFDDTGFMAAWSERQAVAHLWIDARRGSSASFAILTRLQKGFLSLRALAKEVYLDGKRRWARRRQSA